jgi:hypothetical protein
MVRLTEWRGEHAAIVNHHENYIDKLAAFEDTGLTPEDILCIRATQRITPERLAKIVRAEFEDRLVILPCKVGDTVRDKIADYIFTIQTVELGHKAGTLFRCGNPGTEDYMAFYDFEIGEKIEILTCAEAEDAMKGEREDV